MPEGPISENRGRCPYCLVGFLDKTAHVETTRHCLNRILCRLSEKREKYAKDRHGTSVLPSCQPGIELQQFKKRRIYYCNISLDRRTVSFGLHVKNDSETNVILLEATRLVVSEEYEFSRIVDNVKASDEEPGITFTANLFPGTSINFILEFTNPGVGCYRLPIHFKFLRQGKSEGKESKEFSIIREIQVRVQGEVLDERVEAEKSPYTGDSWKHQIEETVYGLQENKNQIIIENKEFAIPPTLKKLLKNDLIPFKGMTPEERSDLDNFVSQFQVLNRSEARLKTAVRRDNYADFFHNLLYVDEQGLKNKMSKYNMFGVTMVVRSYKEVQLDVPGLAEKRPSVLKHDVVFVRLQIEPTIQYTGQVKQVCDNSVLISGFREEFVERLLKAQEQGRPHPVDVRFAFSRHPIVVQHRALRNLTEETLNLLFPRANNCENWPRLVQPDALKKRKFFNPAINENSEQKQAVFNILQGTSLPAPYILFGPPGTGKTVTLVEAILQVKDLFKQSHILVCAQSNSACDYIASLLYTSGYCTESEIFRLNSASRADDPPKEIEKISSTIPQKDLRRLRSYRIIVCTLITAGRFSQKPYPNDHQNVHHSFTHVFIDEAAQAAECEALVAINGLLEVPVKNRPKGLLVLAGDPKQLGPVCGDNKSNDFGLGVSLLERLMESISIYDRKDNGYDSRFITKLVRNFRSHGEILELPNKHFYHEELIPQVVKDTLCKYNLWNPKQEGRPVVFHGVIGEEKREGKSPSYFNVMEISVVIDYVKKLLNSPIANKVKAEDIGVITPYTRQVYKLKQKLENLYGRGKIEVGTTETFQGREKRVIIVSTVRSRTDLIEHDKKYRLGFLREPKRFNVIITRAQSKLIVVGNPIILSLDPFWQDYLENAVGKGSYFGCPLRLRDSEWEEELYSKVGRIV